MTLTTKKIKGYYHAKHEWISANDNYNKEKFGITQEEYGIMRRIESSLFGILVGTQRMTLKAAKDALPYIQYQ